MQLIIITSIISTLIFVYLYPVVAFLFEKFDLRLFLTTIVLIFMLLISWWLRYKNNIWKDEHFLAFVGILLAVLFFISETSQKNLNLIRDLNTSAAYNCSIVNAHLRNAGKDNTTSFSYYHTNILADNLGFTYEIYGASSTAEVRDAIYYMNYTNALLDMIKSVNVPGDREEAIITDSFVLDRKKQITATARELRNIMGCEE